MTAAVSAYGLRRCVPYVLGLVAGTLVVLASVASGVTAALPALPVLRVVLLAASAAYILHVAYRVATIRRSGKPGPGRRRRSRPSCSSASPTRRHGSASQPSSQAPGSPSALAVAIMTAWTLVGASVAPLLRDERHSRIVNRSLAVALVAATAVAVLH